MHYGKLPKETEFERSIADRVKSRKQKLNIINKNKERINNELFNPTRVGLFLATYGLGGGGGGGVDSIAKISDNDAIHLKLGTLIL